MEELGKLIGTLLEAAYNCIKHDVFVEYAPHVNTLEIRIFKDGWETWKESEKHHVNLDQTQALMKIKELTKYINYIGEN